jgi:hypothetical protein
MSVEHTGGISSYYRVWVNEPVHETSNPYEAECQDIIESLNMSFSEGNAFKAIWRTAAARQGKKKQGNTAIYDAEKILFFGKRIEVSAKHEADQNKPIIHKRRSIDK